MNSKLLNVPGLQSAANSDATVPEATVTQKNTPWPTTETVFAVTDNSAILALAGAFLLFNAGVPGAVSARTGFESMDPVEIATLPAPSTPSTPLTEVFAVDTAVTVAISNSGNTPADPDAQAVATYEQQISSLELEQENLQSDLALIQQESAELSEESLQLNTEILELELALAESYDDSRDIIEIKTVYNFVNDPGSVAGSSSFNDESFYSQDAYAQESYDVPTYNDDELIYGNDQYSNDELIYGSGQYSDGEQNFDNQQFYDEQYSSSPASQSAPDPYTNSNAIQNPLTNPQQ